MEQDELLPRQLAPRPTDSIGHKTPLAGTINERYSDGWMPMAPNTKVAILVLAFALMSSCGVDRSTGSEGSLPGQCIDGVDNDGDGTIDCLDPDCSGAPDCSAADDDATDDDDSSADDDDASSVDDDDDSADDDDSSTGDDDASSDDDDAIYT